MNYACSRKKNQVVFRVFVYKNNFKKITSVVRDIWNRIKLYFTSNESQKKTFFCLPMFPYPSAMNLHIGHPLGYIANDIVYRFLRMKGYNVLCPFGYDSFGLPAEQYAIQTGQHPEVTTSQNIENMQKQIDELGLSFDPDRKIITSDKSYYKWTQWIFLKMYNSFFDHTEIWNNGFSEVKGKTKDISVLRKYLQESSWYVDSKGVPAPNETNVKYNYSEEDIRKTLNNARIAYLDSQYVNWCPGLGTVLSNEEVTKDGKSERGNYPVLKKKMKQWMLRITRYSDRLLDFKDLDWPEETIKMQQNWIGRSIGMKINFIDEDKNNIEVFTTRPDTLAGVTFIAVSQGHPIYGMKLPFSEEKIGVFTGKYAYHVFEKTAFGAKIPFVKKIPIWVTNYVLSDYGSGAVMGVPAHDERDFEFAKKYALEIKLAIVPDEQWLIKNTSSIEQIQELKNNSSQNFGKIDLKNPFCEKGELFFAEEIGINARTSLEDLMKYFEKQNIGKIQTSYRLRDWVFSRQRYWGEPFPIVYSEDGTAYPVDESELPVELPQQVDFKPDIGSEDPSSPLGRSLDWIEVKGNIIDGKFRSNQNGQKFRRETNTMPNWAGSSWYYLRYLDPKNDHEIISEEAKNYWCKGKFATVDLYIGGSEHAVLHHLYARFWHMILFDLGVVPNPEPFKKLIHQGLITADAYLDKNGSYVDVKEVEVSKSGKDEIAINKNTGEVLAIEKGKMGKRYKNGVDPIEIIEKQGADVLRLHLMYMGPLTQSRPWNDNFIGMERFCQNVSSMIESAIKENREQLKETEVKLHKTIKLATENYEANHYNRCISLLIEFYNACGKDCSVTQSIEFLKLLHPLAPELSEYWYQQIKVTKNGLNLKESILLESWPAYDSEMLISKIVKATIMINGKLKKVVEVDRDSSDDSLKQLANSITGAAVDKTIIIRGEEKIVVNIVS